jgi:hypothetical protein
VNFSGKVPRHNSRVLKAEREVERPSCDRGLVNYALSDTYVSSGSRALIASASSHVPGSPRGMLPESTW